MNVPRYENFILSHFKSLEHNKQSLCRDPLFISSVEVDGKQSLSYFLYYHFLCEKGPQEDRSVSDERRSLDSRVKRGPVDLHINLYISARAWDLSKLLAR